MRRSAVKFSTSRQLSANSGSENALWGVDRINPNSAKVSPAVARASLGIGLAGDDRAFPTAAAYKAALGVLARQLTRVAEDERQKIAELLHDHFGQDLLLIKLKLQQMANAPTAEFQQRLSEIADIAIGLIEQTRASIRELSASYICDMGFDTALQLLARDIQNRYGLACRLVLESRSAALSNEAQRVLYRAVRELILNVVKHACASQVEITAKRKLNALTIEVRDDGCGFEPEKAPAAGLTVGSFGLFSIRANLAPLGGNLRVLSKRGKGTRAMVSVPFDGKNRTP
jgi:signal transduction histidine kinase